MTLSTDPFKISLGTPIVQGPYVIKNAKMSTIMVPADPIALEDLCDRLLNAPIPGKQLRYEPLVPAVFFTLAKMETYPKNNHQSHLGGLQEETLNCWILTQVRKRYQTTYYFDHLAWFTPYAFVNNTYSLISNREMYSLREMLASFDSSQNEAGNPECTMEILAFRQFTPDTEAKMQTLLELRQPPSNNKPAPIQAWTKWQDAVMGIFQKATSGPYGSQIQAGLDAAQNPLTSLLQKQQSVVFHKWFGDDLELQEEEALWIGEASLTVNKFTRGRLLPDGYELNIHHLDSHPLAEMLGLQDGSQPIIAGWQLELDYEIGMGEDVYDIPRRQKLFNYPRRDRSFGFPILRGPYQHKEAEVATFVLKSDVAALERFFETLTLNEQMPEGQEIRPLPYLILRFSRSKLHSLDAHDKRYGYLPETNISFWVLMQIRKVDKDGNYQHERLVWFVPYSLLDNQYSLVADREIFSLHDLLANFDLSKFALAQPNYTVDVLGFDNFNEGAAAQNHCLIEVAASESKSKKKASTPPVWDSWVEATQAVHDAILPHITHEYVTEEQFISFFADEQSIIFLKPYYSIGEPGRIFYRGLGEAPIKLTKFHEGNFQAADCKVTLHHLASHPVVQMLGLPDGEQTVLTGWWQVVDLDILTSQDVTHSKPGPQKVAVLGGGISALTTVFELTNQPAWRDQYDITVYQLGWRLGGRLASGRNKDIGSRIEEETMMHALYGFYDNTFRMIRAVYEELNGVIDLRKEANHRDSAVPLFLPGFIFETWKEAFNQKDFFIIMDKVGRGWEPWQVNLPPNNFTPGDEGPQADLWGYLNQILDLVKVNTPSFLQGIEDFLFQNAPAISTLLEQADKFLNRLGIDLLGGRTLSGLEELMTNAHSQAQSMGGDINSHYTYQYDDIVHSLQLFLKTLTRFERILPQPTATIRRLWLLFELAIINMVGTLEDHVLTSGFEVINHLDYREWLAKHGASNRVLRSAPVRALYTIFEAYPGGFTSTDDIELAGNLSAGTALHVSLLMAFGYKGSAVWLPKTCMGEVVVAPLYHILEERGVKFEFFHKVEQLIPNLEGTIGQVVVNVQATVKEDEYGDRVYIPTYMMDNGVSVWPNEPLYDQLEPLREDQKDRPERTLETIAFESFWSDWPGIETKTLELGKDFDIVVLGIALGALETICKPLTNREQNSRSWLKWRNMFQHVETLQTQGIKLWFKPPLGSLGWPLASPASGAYVNPLNSSLDMTHTVPFEEWPPLYTPQTIISFVGPLPDSPNQPKQADPGYPIRMTNQVRVTSLSWLEEHIGAYCPYFVDSDGRLNYSKLADTRRQSYGEARFDVQYWAANINPSNRGILSVKGSNKYRMTAGGTGFSNMYVVGDWIDNEYLNIGCVEAAVIAGIQGAKAISGVGQPILTVLPKIEIG